MARAWSAADAKHGGVWDVAADLAQLAPRGRRAAFSQ